MAGATALPAETALRPLARPDSVAAAAETAETASADAEAEALAGVIAGALRPATPLAPPEPLMPDAAALAAPAEATTGPETNLPLPRYVSLKTDDANVRRGPSLSHRIDWVFTRAHMPLMITAEYGNWRRVVDREGLGGWVHYSLLSGNRTVIVDRDMAPLYARADENAPVNALIEAGVIARIEECTPDWCRINAGGYRGWSPKSALWGVAPGEVLD
ncbi:MAG: hypothetical protein IT542_11955 [Rubellimicrobium sp.]|nr:hypothetical protein [Rubellimicrobium sp.]